MTVENTYEITKIIHEAIGIPVGRNFIGWGITQSDAIQLATLRQLKRIADHLERAAASPPHAKDAADV